MNLNDKVEGCCKAHMGNWRRAQRRKIGKASRTPGKLKNENCQATGFDKIMAKRNRSYKHRDYWRWCERKTG